MIIAIVVCLLAMFSFAAAEDSPMDAAAPTRIFQLDEVQVTETAIKRDIETPNSTIVLPELLLQGIGSTLDGALKRQPGVDVQRLQEVGGALDDDSIKIRGFGARRILLMIDGRPLNTPGTAGGYFIDWTTVPLNNVETIEVIKGVSDPRYGNYLGGALNLVTKKPESKPTLELQGLRATFDTWTVSFFHGWKPGAFEYSLSGGYSTSDGYLKNGDFSIKNINLHLGYEFPWQGKLTADAQYIWVKKGFIVPNRLSNDFDSPNYNVRKDDSFPASDGEIMYGGMGATSEPGSWWKKEKIYYTVAYEQAFSKSFLTLDYWQNYGDRDAYNTQTARNRTFHKKFFDDRSYGGDVTYKLFLGNHAISTGVNYATFRDKGDKNLPDDFRAPFRDDNFVNSKILGVYIMDDITVRKDLIITPGLRYMAYDGNAGPAGRAEGIEDISMSGVAPSLKATYAYTPGSLVYLSAARALRMPTPPEHFWHFSVDAGVDTSGLPFKKEDGLVIQGGWKAQFPTRTRVEVSPYYYFVKDFIQFDLINFVSYNIDSAKLYGVEIEVAQQLGVGFSAFANYTFQHSTTKGDPFVANFIAPQDRGFDQIPGLPEQKVNAGIQYKGPRKEKITLYLRYVSDQKVIYNNNVLGNTNLRVREQDAFVTFDVEASYPITKNIAVTGYVYNIANRSYQERFGFPAAERNYGIGVKGTF